jgi:MSHA pilin protein MshC
MLTGLHRPRRSTGFSLVELVVTITIVGILAVAVGSRFVGKDTFESRGFYDQATGVVRFAQKTAIAWRSTTIYVCVTTTGVSAGTAAGCATPLPHPVITGAALAASAPSGVTLSPAGDFTFDGLGRPSTAKTITVSSTIAGDPARQIVVEAETGYVHP